jgi:hypothetical protein
LDPRLVDLLNGTIASVWGVEILLLMRHDPSRAWNSEALVSELRSSDLVVVQSLERLERAGLIVRDEGGGSRFSPATPELKRLTDQLDEEYRLRPGLVRRAIVSPPGDKLSAFTDAFLLRKPSQ